MHFMELKIDYIAVCRLIICCNYDVTDLSNIKNLLGRGHGPFGPPMFHTGVLRQHPSFTLFCFLLAKMLRMSTILKFSAYSLLQLRVNLSSNHVVEFKQHNKANSF